MATLLVSQPPMNSMIVKMKFSQNAHPNDVWNLRLALQHAHRGDGRDADLYDD